MSIGNVLQTFRNSALPPPLGSSTAPRITVRKNIFTLYMQQAYISVRAGATFPFAPTDPKDGSSRLPPQRPAIYKSTRRNVAEDLDMQNSGKTSNRAEWYLVLYLNFDCI